MRGSRRRWRRCRPRRCDRHRPARDLVRLAEVADVAGVGERVRPGSGRVRSGRFCLRAIRGAANPRGAGPERFCRRQWSSLAAKSSRTSAVSRPRRTGFQGVGGQSRPRSRGAVPAWRRGVGRRPPKATTRSYAGVIPASQAPPDGALHGRVHDLDGSGGGPRPPAGRALRPTARSLRVRARVQREAARPAEGPVSRPSRQFAVGHRRAVPPRPYRRGLAPSRHSPARRGRPPPSIDAAMPSAGSDRVDVDRRQPNRDLADRRARSRHARLEASDHRDVGSRPTHVEADESAVDGSCARAGCRRPRRRRAPQRERDGARSGRGGSECAPFDCVTRAMHAAASVRADSSRVR